ncbi:MAG: hypothetical protein JO273_03740 [Methylobacteriaceae bacterium]|nr:hypothetical protein [Methylobacteriaceae bacterium]
MSLKASVILFANDLVDEGYEEVVDTVSDRTQADALTMACNYHHSRDVLPHNPRRRILYMRGGVFFRPDPARFEKIKIKPDVVDFVNEEDPLARLVATAERHGMAVRGWTNNMHSTVHASRHPDCAVQNAFGDAYITTLCPANPDVRAYVCALNGDLARYSLQSLLVESACFMPFDHGYHHERAMVPIAPAVKYMLGLCFCPHCRRAGKAEGAAVDELQAFVRREVDRALNGEASALDGVAVEESAIAALAGGEMRGFLEARKRTVASLIADMAEAARPLSVHVMEWSGGLRAVGAGMQVGTPAGTCVSRAWQDGVDVAEVARACDGLSVLGYVPAPETLRADLQSYRALLPEGQPLSVALRPMWPDCESPDVLAAKLRVLEEAGAAWADFYHYAFMRLSSLDWIGEARAAVAGG